MTADPSGADDRRAEPTRPPDLWLPPTATGLSSAPASWRQPPGWQAPAPWQQPPAAAVAAVRQQVRRKIRRAMLVLVPAWLLLATGIALGITHVPRSTTSTRPAPTTPVVPSVWTLAPGQLRPDLAQASFASSMDGSFDLGFVAAAGGTWLALTDTDGDASLALHGIDPGTGAARWRRPLDGALCTTEPSKAGLVLCASVLARDPASGLGTRWQLHLVDPATGADRLTRDVDGWFSAVHWTGRAFVALEQRQPAPHAVVRAFRATDLGDLWTRDLAPVAGQNEMFSEDKIIRRPDRRAGVALDRPRFRDVGSGLVALWAGQRTAFIDAADGRLVMMPHCSRLVDDGTRLWCNELDGATAYSYAGRPLVRVHGPRLAYPAGDAVGVDHDRAVFLDDDGAGVTVNPRTGDVGTTYTPPGRGSAFGTVTMPSAATVGDRTFLVGGGGAMLLDPARDRVTWRNPSITVTDVPLVRGDATVLLGAGDLDVVDLATGGSTARLRVGATYAVAVGDRVAGVGLDELSLLQL